MKFKDLSLLLAFVIVIGSISSCGMKRPLHLPGEGEIDKIKQKKEERI